MVNLPVPPRASYKAFLWDYDSLLTYSDDECCFSLSAREIQIILAQVDPIAWKTRYKPTNTEIDVNLLQKWHGNLVRKLMTGCCPDDGKNYRFLPDGTYQSSDDGGETWIDAPLEDPRNDVILAPPLSGSDSEAKRCAAADNITAQYAQMRDNTITLLTGGTTVLLIVAGIVGAIGGIFASTVVGAAIAPMLFGLAGLLLSLTPESVGEQLDTAVMEQFRCLVYCVLGTDGRMTATGLTELLDQIASDFTGFPETFFYTITASLGVVGLSNAAALGTATSSDCGDCDCSPECVDEGNIMEGSLNAISANYIDIDATLTTYNGLTKYWAVYGTLEEGFCCYYCSFGILAGSIESGALIGCGGGAEGGAGYKRRIEFYSTVPFTIRYNFDPDEDGC